MKYFVCKCLNTTIGCNTFSLDGATYYALMAHSRFLFGESLDCFIVSWEMCSHVPANISEEPSAHHFFLEDGGSRVFQNLSSYIFEVPTQKVTI